MSTHYCFATLFPSTRLLRSDDPTLDARLLPDAGYYVDLDDDQ